MTKISQKKHEEVHSNEVECSNDEDLNVNSRMNNLLLSQDGTIEDKIATVKTAQMVDRGRFETAIKTLMKR